MCIQPGVDAYDFCWHGTWLLAIEQLGDAKSLEPPWRSLCLGSLIVCRTIMCCDNVAHITTSPGTVGYVRHPALSFYIITAKRYFVKVFNDK